MDEKTVIRVVRGRHRISTHPYGDRGEEKKGFLRRITTGLSERTVKKGRGYRLLEEKNANRQD